MVGADDVADALAAALSIGARRCQPRRHALPAVVYRGAGDCHPLLRPSADELVFDAARTKTDAEIANAREATRIAELGYRHLLEITRPGMSEDALAVELKWYMKSLGADDNFLLLCAGPHNRAVQPSTGRKFQKGDIILAEITPSYRGQLAQICRTVVLGPPSAIGRQIRAGRACDGAGHRRGPARRADGRGLPRHQPVLEAEGYGEYCHPPHIRRRGHGLGFASVRPGDVALDNDTLLEPDMVFMIHPNQYLPETGYLFCGEPVLLTPNGAKPLTAQKAALATVAA